MNIGDHKFLNLRRQLDEFGYTQTLHPDSFQLVSRLLKDQMQALMELDKRKAKETSNSQQSKTLLPLLEQQVDQLQADKKALEAEKRALERQLQDAKRGGTVSIAPDQRTLRLQANVNELRVKLEEAMTQFSSQRAQLQGEVEELTVAKHQLEGQNQRLRSLSSSSVGKLEEENHELTLIIDRKNKDIKQLEESNSKARIRIQVLEKTVEELRSQKDSREEPKADSSRITVLLKQELADSEGRWRQARTELQETQEQLQSVRRELRRAREEAASLRQDDSRTRSLDAISKAGLEKYEARLEEAAAQLAVSIEQGRRLKEQLADGEAVQERLQSKLKEIAAKGKQLAEQNSDLQSEVQMLTGKLTTTLKRTRDLESSNSSLQKQLKEANEAAQLCSSQRLLKELGEEKSKAEQLRREMTGQAGELRLLQQQIKVLRESAEVRTVERDKAQIQCKRLQTILAEGSKNLQAMQLQKEELMKENRQLKAGRQQIASSDQATKSQLFVARQRASTLELQVEELRAAIGGSQASIAQLQGEVRRLQRELSLSQSKNQEVFQDNRQMVSQLKLLEQRKKELQEKLVDLQQREKLKNDTSMVARREFDQLLANNRQLQQQLARKDHALRMLDAQRDELQNQLDSETEAKARLQHDLDAVLMEAKRVGKQADQRDFILNDLKARLSRAEFERDDLDNQLHRHVEENMQLKEKLTAHEVAIVQLQNESNNLTISNVEGQKEAERGRIRAAQLERKLRERTKDFQEERERATALGILNGELHADIERERAQAARLQGFMRQLEEANNSMYSHLMQKDQQLQHYAREVDQAHRQESQYRLQIESYQRQLDNLTQDLDFARQELRQTTGDRQALRAERNWKKELAGQSQDWRSRQEQRYAQLQGEFDRKRREVDVLREQNRKLEGLLGEERAKNFQLTRQMEQQSSQATPRRALLVQSRVESYHSQNENHSNMHSRSISQTSQPESTRSAATLQAIRRLQEQYLLTTKPNIRS